MFEDSATTETTDDRSRLRSEPFLGDLQDCQRRQRRQRRQGSGPVGSVPSLVW